MQTLPPNSIIGIIGGGQLGRMTAMAAARLGYRCHIYTDDKRSPAAEVARDITYAPYDDIDALKSFAKSVDVVTFEFENIPHDSLVLLESLVSVRPSAKLLELSQNRMREKDFINDLGIKTTAYSRVSNVEDLEVAIDMFGCPSILKTTEMGYDGKGQVKIEDDTKLAEAWESLQTTEAVLEGFVPFDMEISVIVARGEDGEVIPYIPVQNIHKNHILHETLVPAPIDIEVAREAIRIAGTLAEESELIGLLAVEMFVLPDGKLLVNEVAPRPHNSGHWSMDAALTGQFEQLVRAVCGLPLGDTQPLCPAKMLNLIGEDANDWLKYLVDPSARLHLYGKKETRAGRKMGHVNFLLEDEQS